MYIYLPLLLPLVIGWVLDRLFGDPENLPHPIVMFGKVISFGEKRLNHSSHRKIKGGIFAVTCILSVYIITQVLLTGALNVGYKMFLFFCNNSTQRPLSIFLAENSSVQYPLVLIPYTVIGSILVFYCLAGKTLRNEVRMTFEAVDRSTDEGRKQVSRIVGRDTSDLTPQEIRTAALETLAENLSDGVIAPLFWFFMLGIPGMMAYKMVNTLDSMIGYQNARYKDFGFLAAKIDDVANYVPARLTAILIILTSYTIDTKNANKHISSISDIYQRIKASFVFIAYFGPKHASPNSGWPEAALASILNCRFGGPHNYFGEYFYKPYIGNNPRTLITDDMNIAFKISIATENTMVFILVLFYIICFVI